MHADKTRYDVYENGVLIFVTWSWEWFCWARTKRYYQAQEYGW